MLIRPKKKKRIRIQKRRFLGFIYEFKHVLIEKDLEMVEKYFVEEAEKMEKSKYVEDDKGE